MVYVLSKADTIAVYKDARRERNGPGLFGCLGAGCAVEYNGDLCKERERTVDAVLRNRLHSTVLAGIDGITKMPRPGQTVRASWF